MPAGTPLEVEEAAPVTRSVCVTKPTPQANPPMGGETLWRLISHLSLNHLSLTSGSHSLSALREILRLHRVVVQPHVRVQCEHDVAVVDDAHIAGVAP